jgi:hypothetical protein
MNATLYTRVGRRSSIGTRVGPLWLLFVLVPLWLIEALMRLTLWSVKGAALASAGIWDEYRRTHPPKSVRKAMALSLTREAVEIDADTAVRSRLGVWAVYGIGDRFFHGRFPQDEQRMRALFPGRGDVMATVGLYPDAGSAGRAARGLRRQGFSVAELEMLFIPQGGRKDTYGTKSSLAAPVAVSATAIETVDAAMKKIDFVVGQEYPLAAIQTAFGGDNMSYLPESGGRIVCGRFTRDMNPLAPERVLVGDRPQVRRKAELLARQGGALPVFIKIRPNRWRYHGLMRVVEYVTDSSVFEHEARVANRQGEVAGVLVLTRA